MCQCFHQCWNDDGLSYNSVSKRSNKAWFRLHVAETTKDFSRQICNNYQNNRLISMEISAVKLSPQDTCFQHIYFWYNITIERDIIILHPHHQSTLSEPDVSGTRHRHGLTRYRRPCKACPLHSGQLQATQAHSRFPGARRRRLVIFTRRLINCMGSPTGCKNHISLLSKKNKINALDANMLWCSRRTQIEIYV